MSVNQSIFSNDVKRGQNLEAEAEAEAEAKNNYEKVPNND